MTQVWDESAASYRHLSETIAFYDFTNTELVRAARLGSGMNIVDLACGAGHTTRAIIENVGSRCSIYAIDSSREMIRLASESHSLSCGPVYLR